MIFYRYALFIVVSIIFALGLVMIFNTSSAEVLDHALAKSTHTALKRQIGYAFAGIILGVIVWNIGYQSLLKASPYLLLLFTFFLLLCLIPGIGRTVNGSRRWIQLMGFSFQPSEFVKYILPGYLIYTYFQKPQTHMKFKEFLWILARISIPLGLILIEPNNGTVGVIALTIMVLFILAEIPSKFWAIPMLVLALVASVSVYNLPYLQGRLKVYWNPELDLKGKGHQPHQAKIAAGSGKLWGKGPGNSLQKLSYLPEAQNDYIAAIFGEEFGFLGITSLIALYMLIGVLGFSIAFQSSDLKAFYLASCITFLITFQAFMNLGVVSGLLPSTGLNLPFFSQGGTSLMANLMGIGILLNLSKSSKVHYLQEFSWTKKEL